MIFPERDLTDQYISASYEDVLQIYLNTGSLLHFLNGLGDTVLSIPTSSLDSQAVLRRVDSSSYSDFVVTASFVLNFNPNATASYALSSSNSVNSETSSYALTGPFTTIFTGSTYPITASWALFATTSSFSYTSSVTIFTQSFSSTAQSASWASSSLFSNTSLSASWASSSISSSYALNSQTASYLVYPSSFVLVSGTSTSSLILQTSSINNSIFINYTLNDGENFRAGNVVVLYNTGSVNLTETTTTDIGDSSGLIITTNISNTFVTVSAVNNTSNVFNIKYHYDVL